MKKVILTMAAVFALSFANAQKREKGTIELIPTIGYSSSSLMGDDEDADALPGVRFGVAGDYYFNDRWSIRSGLINESMGASALGVDLKLNYLTVPLNANWHFGGSRGWNLNFGFTPAFLTNAKFNDIDVKDDIQSVDFGLSFGIGYKVKVSDKFCVLFDYQVYSGFNNIYSDSEYNSTNFVNSFNVGGVFKL